MPEIKHNFTKGKMNKDLDERLIPNGEYRDAMNIQVSTSEGADVGTIQNILGNSLIAGQNNILDGAYCVGSIADEKNDKLYWFISNSSTRIVDLIDQSVFEPLYTRIENKNMILEYDNSSGSISPVFVEAIRIAISAQGGGAYNCPATAMLELHDATGIVANMYVHGINSSGVTIFSSTVTSVDAPVTHAGPPSYETTNVNLADNPCSTFTSTMWYIFSWQPNITDSKSGILEFSNDEHITGINIIDGMLFWTDNNSEPKKINIERCKAGTLNFHTQTRLINDAQSIDYATNVPIRAEHCTVIKKPPSTPPIIELESERDPGNIYTGVMRITRPFTGGPANNTSSFAIPWYTGISSIKYDFSGLKVGDTFSTMIETDIDGNSGFTLDWDTGDTILFKEFENDIPPSTPITNYRIKTKIEDWGSHRETDALSELAPNGDFTIPNTTGQAPDGWDGASLSGGISYSVFDPKLVFDDTDQYKKLQTTNTISFTPDEEYEVRFTLSDVTAGGIAGYIAMPHPSSGTQRFKTSYYYTDGIYTENLMLDSTQAAASGTSTSYEDKFYFQAIGNGENDASWDNMPQLVNTTISNSNINSTVGAPFGEWFGDGTANANVWKISSPSNSIDPDSAAFRYLNIDDAAHSTASIPHTIYLKDIMLENLIKNRRYQLELEVTIGTPSGNFYEFEIGVANNSNVGSAARFNETDFNGNASTLVISGASATKTIEFESNTNSKKIDLFIKSQSVDPYAIPFTHTGHQIAGEWNSGTNRNIIYLDAIPSTPIPIGTEISNGVIPANTTVIAYYEDANVGYADITISNDTTAAVPAGTTLTFTPNQFAISSTFGVNFDIKVNLRREKGFTGNVENISIKNTSTSNARQRFKVLDIEGVPPKVEDGEIELRYAADKQEETERLFEFKFPRFATRYKYEDGEYSTFSPFTEIAFLPGSFDYHPKKGYNLGMTNRIKTIIIKNVGLYVPDDVTSIDILYKEEDSPNIYVIDTIKHGDWFSDYTIESEMIHRTLPSNQLLRPWDNVPKKALAQDIVGNRIVYGNYLQGYDLKSIGNNNYVPEVGLNFLSNDIKSKTTKSIKSLREYELGVVFVDKYGRETPVIPPQKNTLHSKKITKELASKANQISVNFNNADYMKDMKYFKFFIKETSGEYYNLAMDRFYDAEDDNVWISFPSSDRNKIDIDTYLILKKVLNQNEPVTEPAEYKVLAIENEAPDFIKTKKTLIEEREHIFASRNIFNNNLNDAPVSGRDRFKMFYNPAFANSSGSNLDLIEDGVLYVEFTNAGGSNTSKRYRINGLSTNFRNQTVDPSEATYNIKLDKVLGDDVDFISSATQIKDNTIVKIYKHKIENSPEFDGKFFVKLEKDIVFTEKIAQDTTANTEYKVVESKKLYYMDHSTHETTHSETRTGQTNGLYSSISNLTTPGVNKINNNQFGRFACYFRNYDKASSNLYEIEDATSAGTMLDVSPYVFGSGTKWKNEFLKFTSSGDAKYVGGWDTSATPSVSVASQASATSPVVYTTTNASAGTIRDDSNLKEADVRAKSEQVWFIDRGKTKGRRSTNDNLDWKYIGQDNADNDGIYSSGNDMRINIGMGGIFHDEVSDSSDKFVNDFFSIGEPGGNPFYQDEEVGFVNKLKPARQFRFREDPYGTIYTVQSGVSYQRFLRYIDGTAYEDSPHPSTTFPWTIWSTAGNSYQLAQLSPNFTRNWNMKFRTQDGLATNSITWDPTNGNTLGPITGGLKLKIDHSASAAPTSSLAVRVDSLDAAQDDGSVHKITEGMILTSHSDGTETHTDGTADNKDWLVIWKIEKDGSSYNLFLTGYSRMLLTSASGTPHLLYSNQPTVSQELIFQQPAMNGYSNYSANRLNAYDHVGGGFTITDPGLVAIGYHIEFLEPIEAESELPINPAVWETEPKKNTDLNIYYEASGLNPILLTDDTKNLAVPIGSTVKHVGSNLISEDIQSAIVTVAGFATDGSLTLSDAVPVGNYLIKAGDQLRITKPDGSSVDYTIKTIINLTSNSSNTFIIETATVQGVNCLYNTYTTYNLNWSNCYSFGNGVESNRIKDSFNLQYILNGVKVSTTLEEGGYKEEHRKYGLIYSGLYNSIGGINNLNQFIQAEKITKDINPTYGSIQKLHTRDSDLITLCEDKVLRIQANKDALYNADGNMQVTATHNVLGQAIPFVGEYGISKNPESFVSEAYRSYFTDKQRGAVMRLSKDGLTPISMHGMKDWFRDNLKLYNRLIGSYDDRNDEYNLTLRQAISVPPKTISFREDVTGWVSFKSFYPENAISCANDYFTILGGKLYKHYDESKNRNTFYSGVANYPEYTESSVTVLLNDQPGSVKSFHTLDYEGSQSRVEGINNFVIKDTTNVVDIGRSSDRYGYFDLTAFESVMKPNTWNISNKAVIIPIKQYRNNILIFSGNIKAWNLNNANSSVSMSWGHLRKEPYSESSLGDWLPGDIITTETQEKTVDHFNSMPKDGWYVSNIETDKQKGNLSEFIEKEGKWFNYIKGIDSDVSSTTDFGAFDIQGIGVIDSMSGNDITFSNNINSSLQVGDTLYSETMLEVLGDNIVDMNTIGASMASGFSIDSTDTASWDSSGVTAGIHYFSNVMLDDNIIEGRTYRLRLDISSYAGTGSIGVSNSAGVSSNARRTSDGITEVDFVSQKTGGGQNKQVDLFGRDTNSATIRLSVREITTGSSLGFDRLESDQLQKCGVVTSLTNNTVTVDDSGTLPSARDYIMFAKNHAINTSSLLGYYAETTFKNNSIDKAELFSVNSEITESSK